MRHLKRFRNVLSPSEGCAWLRSHRRILNDTGHAAVGTVGKVQPSDVLDHLEAGRLNREPVAVEGGGP
jgi:hypothetical protein